MKDLTKYIESLIDEVKLPLEIRLQEDGTYYIEVTKDLKESWVFYMVANERKEIDIKFIRIQLKKYLPQLEFVVKVKYINYPKNINRQELIREYKIKQRVWEK